MKWQNVNKKSLKKVSITKILIKATSTKTEY